MLSPQMHMSDTINCNSIVLSTWRSVPEAFPISWQVSHVVILIRYLCSVSYKLYFPLQSCLPPQIFTFLRLKFPISGLEPRDH